MTKSATPYTDAAEQYARDVINGKVIACKWIKLLAEKHFRDKELKGSPYYFEPLKSERVAKFLQLLPHTKGKWAAKRDNIKLEPWQLFAVCLPFGWLKHSNNKRRYRTIFVFVPRKNGKSIIGGGIGNYMFSMDGECGAEVYSGATTEKQAWEVFRPAKTMIDKTPQLQQAAGISVNASNMIRLTDGSRFEPIIGKPGDGSSPSCAIIDEYHEHADSSMFDTMETGMGSREQPLMLVITTAGSSIGGACHLLFTDSQKMLDGSITLESVWPVLYTIDDGDEWSSPDVLRKANPNFGVSIESEFLLARQQEAMVSSSKQNTFRTKHLNEWVGAKTGWMNIVKWKQCPERLPLADLEGRACYIGLDLASKVDIAAMVAIFPPIAGDDRWHIHGNYYTPENRVLEMADTNANRYKQWHIDKLITLTDGDVIDFEYIKEDMRQWASRFDVVQVGFDPWQATQLSNDMLAEGLPMVEVRQTVQNMSEPMKEAEKLVLQKLLAHGNCPILTWMASNVVAKLDVKDNIYPNKDRPENKIDGIVALLIGLNRAVTYLEAEAGFGMMVL